MARLTLDSKEGQQTVELQARNSLGRHPSNTIQVLDKIVSKEHCIVELRATGFVLRDLGSLNGTYVNGSRVQGERALSHGDEISMGQTKARFDGQEGPLPGLPLPAVPGAAASVPSTGSWPPGAPRGWQQPQSLAPHSGSADPSSTNNWVPRASSIGR